MNLKKSLSLSNQSQNASGEPVPTQSEYLPVLPRSSAPEQTCGSCDRWQTKGSVVWSQDVRFAHKTGAWEFGWAGGIWSMGRILAFCISISPAGIQGFKRNFPA